MEMETISLMNKLQREEMLITDLNEMMQNQVEMKNSIE